MRRTSCASATSARCARKAAGSAIVGQIDDERIEIVVVVAFQRVVMRGTPRQIVFGGGGEAEQHGGVDSPFLRLDDFHRTRDACPISLRFAPAPARSTDRSC